MIVISWYTLIAILAIAWLLVWCYNFWRDSRKVWAKMIEKGLIPAEGKINITPEVLAAYREEKNLLKATRKLVG